MAIDIENILADTLLSLCHEKEYKDITIKDIRSKSGISRTGFYNHFRDKNDLAHWIYYHRVQTFFTKEPVENFYESLLIYYRRVQKYHYFLKSVLKVTEQNCLKDYMYEHPFQWELQYNIQWYQKNQGKKPVMDELRFFTEYHSMASVSMTIKWIQEDMPFPPEEMARRIAYLKKIGFAEILNDADENIEHPYK